jgi:protein phosphatase 2C family protein 2/3
MRADRDDSASSSGLFGAGSAFGGFARVVGSTGGISFHPSGGISGGLMFANEDSDEEDSEDEMLDIEEGRSFFSDTLGIGGPSSPDATSNLKAQLADFEKDIYEADRRFSTDGLNEGAVQDSSRFKTLQLTRFALDHVKTPQGETPPPPQPLPNGDTKAVEQLKSTPGGDEPSPVVKAEGLMDGTEDPTKT